MSRYSAVNLLMIAFLGLAMDTALAGVFVPKIYFGETNAPNDRRISRANLNGSMSQVIIPNMTSQPDSLALDGAEEKLFYSQSGVINKANLDGTGIQPFLASSVVGGVAVDMEIDAVNGKLYWQTPNSIRRANLDGSSAQIYIASNNIDRVSLDTVHGYVYWIQFTTGIIRRRSLSGGLIETIYDAPPGPDGPTAIAIDPTNQEIYWSYGLQSGLSFPGIRKRAVSGGTIQDVYSGEGYEYGQDLAIDQLSGKLYLSDSLSDQIYRLNTDGSGFTSIGFAANPQNVALLLVPEPSTLLFCLPLFTLVLRRSRL